MKKGDQIKQVTHMEAGTQIAHNFPTLAEADQWAKDTPMPLRGQISAEFPETFHVVLSTDYDLIRRATVNWVVDKEVAITYVDDGLCNVINLDEEKWEVEIESAPSYQSSVEGMTEHQLRDSLECLRSQRRTAPRVSISAPRAKVKREEADPMLQALAGLDPEKKKALMIKLGLV